MAVKWRNVETDSDLDFTSESGSISEDLASSMSGNSAYTPVKSSKKSRKSLFTPIPTNGLNPIKTNTSSVSDENALLANIAAKAYEHPIVREALKQAALRANNEPITPENRQITSDEVLDSYGSEKRRTNVATPRDSSSSTAKRNAAKLVKQIATPNRKGTVSRAGTQAASATPATPAAQGSAAAQAANAPANKKTENPTTPQNPTQPVRGRIKWTKEEKEKYAAKQRKYDETHDYTVDPIGEMVADYNLVPGLARNSISDSMDQTDRDQRMLTQADIGEYNGSTAQKLARAGQIIPAAVVAGGVGTGLASGLEAAAEGISGLRRLRLTPGKLPKVTVGKGAGKFGIKFEGGKVPKLYKKAPPAPGSVTEATLPGRITGNGSRQIPPPPGTRTPIGNTVKINGKDIPSVADENTLFRELNNTGLRRRMDPRTGNLESERSFIEHNGYRLIERQRWDETTKSWVKDPNYGKYEYTGQYRDVSGRGISASSPANPPGEPIQPTRTPIPRKENNVGTQQLSQYSNKPVLDQNGKPIRNPDGSIKMERYVRITDGNGNYKDLPVGSQIPSGWKHATKSSPTSVRTPGRIQNSETSIDLGNPALPQAVKERVTEFGEGLAGALSLSAGVGIAAANRTTPDKESFERRNARNKQAIANREERKRVNTETAKSIQAGLEARKKEGEQILQRLNIDLSKLSSKEQARFGQEIIKLSPKLTSEERDQQMIAAYKNIMSKRSRW